MDFIVNPWEVRGDIDYNKLISQFGLQKIENLPKKFKENLLFRRGIIFAHRDFNKILYNVENNLPFCMMTGLMPSGKFHFGHKMVADQMIFYQNLGARVYVTVADIEAYNSRIPDMDTLRETAIDEYLINYVALGLNLDKIDFYFQSKRSLDAKKSNAYYSLQNMLSRHVTLNEMKSTYGDIEPSKIMSSLLQSSDMLHPQLDEFEGYIETIVPVGVDQDPHLRLARDLSNRIKQFKFKQISSTYHSFMPGLKGGKMSSSDETTHIALTDLPQVAEKKVKKYAFSGGRDSVEEHRRLGGNPDIDVSFQMLKYGLEEDDKKLNDIYNDYKMGNLLSGELKAYTIDKLKAYLDEHQKRRVAAKKKVEKYLEGRL